VFITIRGKTHYLWRAADQDGNVLDILVTSRRDTKAATRFFRKLLTGLEYMPRVLITDKLRSYGAAHRVMMPSVEHPQSKYLNNRAENSHQPNPGAGTGDETLHLTRPTRSGSCQRSAGYHRTSGPAATGSTPRNTAARWPSASRPETRSPGLPRPPEPPERTRLSLLNHTLDDHLHSPDRTS
jgi:hypothetical protein